MCSSVQNNVIYSGVGIPHKATPSDYRIHQIVQFLLGRGDSLDTRAITKEHIKAVLIQKNPYVIGAFRNELRGTLHACAQELPPENEVLFETFVSQLIGLLPYSYPEEGETFEIPVKVDGVWKSALYTVD